MHIPLVNLIVNKGHPVEFGKHQVLLLEYEGWHVPIVNLLRVLRLGADTGNLIWAEHKSHDTAAEFEFVTLVANLVEQILLLLVVLPVEVLDFAVVVLVLLPQSVDYGALGLYLSLQVLIGLLHQKHFFLLG